MESPSETGGEPETGCMRVCAIASWSAPASDIRDTAIDAATSRSTMSSVLLATRIGASGLRKRLSGPELASLPMATATRSAERPAAGRAGRVEPGHESDRAADHPWPGLSDRGSHAEQATFQGRSQTGQVRRQNVAVPGLEFPGRQEEVIDPRHALEQSPDRRLIRDVRHDGPHAAPGDPRHRPELLLHIAHEQVDLAGMRQAGAGRDQMSRMPRKPLLDLFDQYASSGRINIQTASEHFTIRRNRS